MSKSKRGALDRYVREHQRVLATILDALNEVLELARSVHHDGDRLLAALQEQRDALVEQAWSTEDGEILNPDIEDTIDWMMNGPSKYGPSAYALEEWWKAIDHDMGEAVKKLQAERDELEAIPLTPNSFVLRRDRS